ncbi:MAG TPA: hypothetical protein ACFYEF_08630, partial [Candidatus Wunengus sp. YC63]|uniref:hypothetical protein n=1 Tax=Candidatus Wunengus sp. YC63 TaxID=3367699 RepID=UPI002712F02D|nr:hypothetical protein [Candidatus Brocadiales bacterium]
MEKMHTEEMELLFRAQLYHILGVDGKSREIALKMAKISDNPMKELRFLRDISRFYKLESLKYDKYNDNKISTRIQNFKDYINNIEKCIENYLAVIFNLDRNILTNLDANSIEDI